MSTSEVANLRQSIETELAAMYQGLNGLAAGISKHQFIEAKMKRLGAYHNQLVHHVGSEQAIQSSYEVYIKILQEKQP